MAGPGTLIGGVVAVGVGEAAGVALAPVLEPQRQEAWAASQARIFDLDTLALLVAQGLLTESAAIAEGKRNGYTPGRVRRAIQLALRAAPVSELLELWRRGEFGDPKSPTSVALVDHGLAKEGIEPQYWDAIKQLFYGRLDPSVIATAIQRGVMVAPFDLPYALPAGVGNVAAFPVSTLSAEEQARAHGVTVEQLRVMTALVGLPLALDQAARGHFRKILTLDDYERAVLEGNTRGEWGAAALEVSREILTAGEYVERQIRGFTDRTGRLLDTDKHGMSHDDSDKLYEVLGRSPSIHTLVVGLARGGKYPGSYANVPEPYRSDIQRSNIREEFAEVAYAARYTYPSAFVLRALAEAGDLGDANAVDQILREIGWKPELAASVSAKWVPVGAATDPYVKKAQTQLWTTTHTSYKSEEIDDAAATGSFTLLEIPADAQAQILTLWQYERSLTRKALTAADVRKALQQGDINAATGVAWTRPEALSALAALGYDVTNANDYLNIPYKG